MTRTMTVMSTSAWTMQWSVNFVRTSESIEGMPRQFSPDEVRSPSVGAPSQVDGGGHSRPWSRRRAYRVTWSRCWRCNERQQGLTPVFSGLRQPRVIYVCEWCRPVFAGFEEDCYGP
jgi:hypothetical protein